MPRIISPSGGSILITSAPRSPRICVATGPSTAAVKSITRIPASGPDMCVSELNATFCFPSPFIVIPAKGDLCIRLLSVESMGCEWLLGQGGGVGLGVAGDRDVVGRSGRVQAVGGAGEVPAGERQQHAGSVACEAHVAQ